MGMSYVSYRSTGGSNCLLCANLLLLLLINIFWYVVCPFCTSLLGILVKIGKKGGLWWGGQKEKGFSRVILTRYFSNATRGQKVILALEETRL